MGARMAKPVFDRDDLATLAKDGVLIKRAFFDAEEIGLLKAACTRDQALAAHTVHQSDSQGRSFVLTAWNAAAKAVWPLCETPRATSMAPVGVSRTKIPPYPPATACRGVPAPMSWR